MLYPMKMSQNRWTAGNALSWALGVMLGLIVGVALLIAIPRMMFTPTVSGDSTQPPTAAAQTGDSSGAATTTEQPGATDETGMASGQTSGSAAQGAEGMNGAAGQGGSEGASQSTDSDTASSTAEQTGGAVQGAGAGEDPTQRSSGAAPTPGNAPQDSSTTDTEGAGETGGAAGTGSTGTAEAGQQFFGGSCAGCHGAEGQGGVGPALNQAATWSDAEFTTALREGRTPEKELSPVMPRFTEAQLSAQQVADVHAYVKSLY